MKLLVMPDDGPGAVLAALDKARTSIEVVIFRLDMKDMLASLTSAIKRGVAVRALIAHTNKGGEKTLRKLETKLLEIGVTVSRTADDFVRYHGKFIIIDGKILMLNGFNFTWLDMERSRSFGVATTVRTLVKDAQKLFQADCDRQEYTVSSPRLIVSPDNARTRLGDFIRGAKKQLLIYDPAVSDPRMLRLIAERQAKGVDVRIIGKVSKHATLSAQKYPGKRLHIRAIIRDGAKAFIGSQSLRRLELDRRREVGVLISERPVVKRMVEVFESDWAKTPAAKQDELTDAASKESGKGSGGKDDSKKAELSAKESEKAIA
jgi:cardiolipin synthase A/B